MNKNAFRVAMRNCMCHISVVRVRGVILVDDALDFLRVEEDSFAQLLGALAVSHGAKVENLNECDPVPLHSSHAPPLLEANLPDATEVGEEILDTLSGPYVPHLQGSVATANNFPSIVLEASDGASVGCQSRLAPP